MDFELIRTVDQFLVLLVFFPAWDQESLRCPVPVSPPERMDVWLGTPGDHNPLSLTIARVDMADLELTARASNLISILAGGGDVTLARIVVVQVEYEVDEVEVTNSKQSQTAPEWSGQPGVC